MKTPNSLTKGEQTRQAIVSAAYDLVVRQGYAATSMRQIAGKAGLALGGIYNHFSSKEEVFLAILEERHPFFQMMPILDEVSGETVEEYVRNAAHTLVSQLGRHPDFLNLMLVEIVEFKAKHVPRLFEKLRPLLMPIAQHIGSRQGDLRPIPPFVLTRAFLGMFFSYYITDILFTRALSADLRKLNANAIDHFADIFLHGILLEEPA
ncbi:MAG TPA: TetR/AcrR family transcriptional regulator [Anaerolineales bacterium]|nr:TetR/AcrR family transcriptional regulator [Anaerolineales bacterium]